MKTFIVGGARCGKSRFAESLALAVGTKHFYLATGWAGDEEMNARIKHHQNNRDARWKLVEEPIFLAEQLNHLNHPDNTVLIDCMTLWLSNLMHKNCVSQQAENFLTWLKEAKCNTIIVSNEVGSGIVPLGNLSRNFVDHAGRLNQSLAAICENVILVVAGLPMVLKGDALQ